MEAEHEAALSAATSKFRSAALDLSNMVPKKSNWELKRALAPQLERLERRTQRAVYELARAAAERETVAGRDDAGQRLALAVRDAAQVDSDVEDDR
jgi:coiled-coil domain-containing protein 12